jgi:hypothetical protein
MVFTEAVLTEVPIKLGTIFTDKVSALNTSTDQEDFTAVGVVMAAAVTAVGAKVAGITSKRRALPSLRFTVVA